MVRFFPQKNGFPFFMSHSYLRASDSPSHVSILPSLGPRCYDLHLCGKWRISPGRTPLPQAGPIPVPYFKGFLWEWCVTSMGMGLTIEGLLEFADMNPELGSRVVVNMHPRGKGYICTPLKTYTHTHTHQKKCELGDNPFLLGARPRVELLVFGYQCGL